MTGLSEPDANVEGVSGALHLLCILRGLLEPRRQLLHHRQLALLCKSFAAVLMQGAESLQRPYARVWSSPSSQQHLLWLPSVDVAGCYTDVSSDCALHGYALPERLPLPQQV